MLPFLLCLDFSFCEESERVVDTAAFCVLFLALLFKMLPLVESAKDDETPF
jgi:hypothetical protein